MSKRGFYDYDTAVVSTDGVILKNDLTSLAELPAGVTDVGAGTNVFSAAGVKTDDAGTSGLLITGVTGQAALSVEGTIRFLITNSNGPFDKDHDTSTGIAENFLALKGGTSLFFNKHATNGVLKLVCSVSLDNKFPGTNDQWYYGNPEGREDFNGLSECIVTWDQCGVKMFIDRLKIFDVSWVNSSTRPVCSTILIGTEGGAGGNYTYKDLLISDKKTVIKSSSHVSRIIHYYCDSYGQLGNYPQCDTGGRQSTYNFSSSDETGGASSAESFTPDGQNGAGYDGPTGTGERGMIPNCQRWLAKKGLFTNKIIMWGEGGSGYETTGTGLGQTIPQRVAIALNGNYDIPDIVVLVAGYNDTTAGGVSGTYQTTIEGVITSIKAANPNVKIIMTTLPYNTQNTANLLLADVLETNAIFKTIADADSSIKLVDIFTIFGGATNDGSGNMSGDFIHPDSAGQAIYGQKEAQAINAFIRNGDNSTISS